MNRNSTTTPKPADLLRADDWKFEYRQKSNPQNSNLEMISYGTYRIAARATSDECFHRGEEALLFCMGGKQTVEIEGESYHLSHYDSLYIPRETAYRIVENSDGEGHIIICKAPAENRHQPFIPSGKKSASTRSASAIWTGKTSI